ncbi:MAG: hypothetical protein HYW81_03320, partial [Parcubacteria group bacterium]|nr:hypothetical protein [Parcubacteria group bacterium]
MLDAILGSHRRVDVDWLHVQRALNRGLTGFLAVWTHVVLWVPPFVIAGYGASPDAFRALAVAFLVGIAWLAWIIRSVFGRDQLAWRSSLLAWIGLALGAVVLAVFALHPMSRFNIFLNTGPVAWFSLVGFVLLLSQERSALARLRGKTGIVLVGLYAVASMYPAVLSYIGGSVNMAPVSVSVERYVQYGLSQYGPWGAGLGRASEGFWSLAELVDVEQIPGAPRLASAYIGMLWEGGAGLLASFLVFVIVPAVYALAASRRALRRLGPASSERKRELRRRWWAFGLVAWLVALVFLPHSFMGILAAGLLVSMALLVPDSASEVHRPHILPLTTRLRLIPARILAVILAVLVVYGAISAARLLAFPQPPDISAGAPSLSGFDHWAIARTLGSQADRTSNPGAVLAQAAAFYQAALPRL